MNVMKMTKRMKDSRPSALSLLDLNGAIAGTGSNQESLLTQAQSKQIFAGKIGFCQQKRERLGEQGTRGGYGLVDDIETHDGGHSDIHSWVQTRYCMANGCSPQPDD